MIDLVVQIPMKPISPNNAYKIVKFGKHASRVKTDDTKMYERDFVAYLNQYAQSKDLFVSKHDERSHSIQVEAFYYLNSENYFTKPKKGFRSINKRSGDLDNMLKLSFDALFRWVGIDDSQVTKIITEKIPTNDIGTMVFRLTLVKHPEMLVVNHEAL